MCVSCWAKRQRRAKTTSGKAKCRTHANTGSRILNHQLGWSPLALACLLEDMEESRMNMLRSSRLDPTLSVQLPPKLHSDPRINFVWIFLELSAPGSFPHDFVYTCWWQETTTVPVVPTPISFSAKLHPSKLMGCNHHHRYTATHPTAHSWVFNSQSMGCKERRARGTQFPMSLTAASANCKRIQRSFQTSPLFARHLRGLQR